ncbi:hypothetical protein ABKV19_001135 [Rosa sericea]
MNIIAVSQSEINSLLSMITVRLGENNFVKWSFQFQSVLEGIDLFGYFDGTFLCPPCFVLTEQGEVTREITSAYKIWKKTDKALLGLLMATLDEDIMEIIVGCKSSYDAWLALLERFSSCSRANIIQLKTDLLTIKKGADSIDKYLLRIKHARDQLSSVGVNLIDEDIVVVTLNGLTDEYAMTKTVIRARDCPISLMDVRAQLLAAERDIDCLLFPQTSMTALAAKGNSYRGNNSNYSTFNDKRQIPSSFGNVKGKGIWSDNSFKQLSWTNSGKSSFNDNSSGGNYKGQRGVECQICNKKGHTANKCYQISECQICRKKGHTAVYCFYRTNVPADHPSHTVVICQICGLKGHVALDCHHRSNDTYQFSVPCSSPCVAPPSQFMLPALHSDQLQVVLPFDASSQPLAAAPSMAAGGVVSSGSSDSTSDENVENNNSSNVVDNDELVQSGEISTSLHNSSLDLHNNFVPQGMNANLDIAGDLPHELQLIDDIAQDYNNHSMLTRAKNCIIKQKTFQDFFAYSCVAQHNLLDELAYFCGFTSVMKASDPVEPKNFKVAVGVPTPGFKFSHSDPSLFVKTTDHSVVAFLLYVDYIVIAGSEKLGITSVISELSDGFDLKNLGPLSFFLGFGIRCNQNGLFLSQEKYAKELIQKADLETCRDYNTPCLPHAQLPKDEGTTLSNSILYRGIVGGLQYLTFTRSDIAYAVNTVCHVLSCFASVKRILRYLQGTINHGLFYKHGKSPTCITGYCDTDWIGKVNQKRSTTGLIVYLGHCLVSWQFERQGFVSRSSIEAEYKSFANTAADISWIRHIFCDLHVRVPAPPLLKCDNLSALALCSNPVFHSRIKHLDNDFHFVRERVQRQDLLLQYVPTSQQTADTFTKGLHSPMFKEHCTNLSVMSPTEIEGRC